MNKKFKVMIKVINSFACKYPDTKFYSGQNLQEKD